MTNPRLFWYIIWIREGKSLYSYWRRSCEQRSMKYCTAKACIEEEYGKIKNNNNLMIYLLDFTNILMKFIHYIDDKHCITKMYKWLPCWSSGWSLRLSIKGSRVQIPSREKSVVEQLGVSKLESEPRASKSTYCCVCVCVK